MAIQTDFDSNYGMTVNGAYVKISSIYCSTTRLRAQIDVYANEQARIDRRPPVAVTNVDMDMSDVVGDIWPAVYELVKQRPEFTPSTDI